MATSLGVAVGLRVPSALAAHLSTTPWAFLLVLAAVPFLSPRLARGPRSRSLHCVQATIGASFAAGVLLGSSTAAGLAASCVRDLTTGDAVSVRGTSREGAIAGQSVRLTLEGVTLAQVGIGRSCRLPRLIVRAERMTAPVAAGTAVVLRGEWVRVGRPSAWPRRPGRAGIAVGKLGESETPVRAPAGSDRGALARALHAARIGASRRLRRRLPADVSPTARALVLAERDDLPGSLRTRFAEAGLAHLLAISGLHVGLIGGFIVVLLRLFTSPARAAVGGSVIVALYVGAIGAPPSAVRASLLLAGWAVARVRGLPARPWDLLGVAAIVALASDPLVLVEPGFQLSFAGFAGLGAGASVWRSLGSRRTGRWPAIEGALRRLPRAARHQLALAELAMACGTGAFLATAPIAAAHFQHVAPAALVSHFVGTPLAGAAIASLAMALFLPAPLHELGAAAATTVIRLMVGFAGWMADLPGAHASVAAPSALTWTAIALGLVGLWNFLRWGRARSAVVPLAAAAALGLAAPALHTRVPGGRSLICTLDVGQGDAAVLRTAGGRWILFDAGPRFGARDAGRDVVVPLLRRYGAHRIDLFVLSHPDLDHVGGFASIHESVPVFRVLDSGHPIPSPGYARFLALTEEDGIRWISAATGDAVQLDNVTVRVLGPPGPAVADGRGGLANESSLLLRVSIGRALVYVNTGDATTEDERHLLATWGPDSLRADLLKVGHHGSRSSSASDFLAAVRPSTAVISAGRGNAYGHPHPAVLERLSRAGVPRVWRTDRQGTLCLEVDERLGWRVQGEEEWTRRSESGTRLDVTKG